MIKREDEDIRRLFQQLREDDERQLVSFVNVCNVGLSRSEELRRHWAAWQLIAGAVAVSLAAAIVMAFMLMLPPPAMETGHLVDGSRLEALHLEMMSSLSAGRFRDPSVVSWSYPTDYLLKPELNPKFSFFRLESQPLPN